MHIRAKSREMQLQGFYDSNPSMNQSLYADITSR